MKRLILKNPFHVSRDVSTSLDLIQHSSSYAMWQNLWEKTMWIKHSKIKSRICWTDAFIHKNYYASCFFLHSRNFFCAWIVLLPAEPSEFWVGRDDIKTWYSVHQRRSAFMLPSMLLSLKPTFNHVRISEVIFVTPPMK